MSGANPITVIPRFIRGNQEHDQRRACAGGRPTLSEIIFDNDPGSRE
jgi:hypothetical protein